MKYIFHEKGIEKMMKRKQYIAVLLTAIFCLAFTGCGRGTSESVGAEAEDGNAQETVDTSEEKQEEVVQEEAQATTEPEETVQEKYLRLAEENLALKEQCSDLYVEYAYYENLRISQSTKGFDLKEQGMFFGALEESKNEPEVTVIDEINVQDTRPVAEEKIEIPELSDEEAEEKIVKLEEENAKLSEEVANLQHQIELYRTMYMGE